MSKGVAIPGVPPKICPSQTNPVISTTIGRKILIITARPTDIASPEPVEGRGDPGLATKNLSLQMSLDLVVTIGGRSPATFSEGYRKLDIGLH